MIVVLDGDGGRVEEDEDDDEPVEPLLLDRPPDDEADLLLVHPKVGVLLELFLQGQTLGALLLRQQLCGRIEGEERKEEREK